MTKEDIVDSVYNIHGLLSKKEIADVVEDVLGIIKISLLKEGKIMISNFGTFEVKNKNSRMGRNPQSGEPMEISARKVLTFKPSKGLKTLVNKTLYTTPT
ncbi:MAG: integration host factor subunit alpha [bacterium]